MKRKVEIELAVGSRGIHIGFDASTMEVELRLETALCAIIQRLLSVGAKPEQILDATIEQFRLFENQKILRNVKPMVSS